MSGARVRIVTDSTAYLPPELLERWEIGQVQLYAGWEGDLRPEASYADRAAFYQRLHASKQLPTTSQPSVGDFREVFEPLAAARHDIVSIHLAAGLSGTWETGREAARALRREGQVLPRHARVA